MAETAQKAESVTTPGGWRSGEGQVGESICLLLIQ